MGWVRTAAGSRFGDIEIHANASNIEVTNNQEDTLERIASRLQVTPEEALQSPVTLVGSVDAIVEQLHAWREQWDVCYFAVQARVMDAVAPVIAKVAGN